MIARAAGLLLALCLACAGPAAASGSDSLYGATLTAPGGQPLALAQYRGKPLLVNFWARWCAPCRAEIPELIELRAAYGKRGLNVIGIGIEEDGEAVADFLKAYEVSYPVGLGKEKGLWLMQALGNSRSALPFTLAIDRKGEIVMRKLGRFTKADFEQIADRLLQ